MVQATTVSPPKVVRIIEPTIPIHETVKTTYRALRVAAYCRVSTKQEEQLHSYETQVKHYTERIQAENGWILEGIYADKGITGTSYKKRDEFNRMIRRCKQGKIDMIIVKSIARFARNTVDCLKFVRMLNDLNVVVYFEEQGIYSNQPGAEFYITIYGSIAQSESENISANVKWGKARSAKEGNVPFHYKNFLGYRKGADGKPEIDPEEAETIRFIYERFLAGDSLSGIAQKLNDLQVPTPSGKGLWQNSTIQSILSNEKYKGDAIINKTYIKDCLSKKVMINNGERPKYYVENNHPAIIDAVTFGRVQEELARRSGKPKTKQVGTKTEQGKYSSKYAMTELLVCGECKTPYRRCTWTVKGQKKIVWRCINRLDFGKKYCHNSPTVEESIYNCIMEILVDMYEHTDTYSQSPRWYTGDYLVWLTSRSKPQKNHAEEYYRYLQRLHRFGFVFDEVSDEWSNPRYPLFFTYYPRMAQLFKERKKNMGGYLARLDFRLFAPKIKLTLDDILRPLSDADREVCLNLHNFALSKGLKPELKNPYTIRYIYKKLYSFELHNDLFRILIVYRLDNKKVLIESLDRFLQVVREQPDRDALIAYIQDGICVCTSCNGAKPFDKRCGVWVNIDGVRRLASMPCNSAIGKHNRGKDIRYNEEDMRMLKRLLEVRIDQVDAYADGAQS